MEMAALGWSLPLAQEGVVLLQFSPPAVVLDFKFSPVVSGAKGDKGDKGDTGDKGDKGDTGDAWPSIGVQAASEAARDSAAVSATTATEQAAAAAASANAFAINFATMATSLINTQAIVVSHHGFS